jgi:hypothetical protein
MPPLTVEYIKDILKYENKGHPGPGPGSERTLYFIETGTTTGQTIIPMAASGLFKKLYTVEINKTLLNLAKDYYYKAIMESNGIKTTEDPWDWDLLEDTLEAPKESIIEFYLGDSPKVLETLLDAPQFVDSIIIFFLDAHYSGGSTSRGSKDCPLLDELEVISRKCLSRAILIIDDVRMFGSEEGNWSEISVEGVLKMFSQRIDQVYYTRSDIQDKDRLVLHLKAL